MKLSCTWGKRIGLLALTLAMGLQGDPVAAESADEAFRKGRMAWDAQRWPEVVAAMRLAITLDGNEGAPVRLYGQRFENYLPHLFLGLALARQGDCAPALVALAESARQGRLGNQEQRWLEAARQQCASATSSVPSQNLPPTTTATGDASAPPAGASATPRVAPAPELRRAAAAYLAQSYGEVSEILADFTPPDAPSRATRHLLRAAALYARYLEGGARDAALRHQADAEAAAFRAAPAGITPASQVFSPVIRQWIRGGG